MRSYYVYILANKKNGTLYVGVTSDLLKRIYQHKNKIIKGFTSKYNINKLVYFETYDDVKQAIYREKKLKEWKREWKIRLIEEKNNGWVDLSLKYSNTGSLPTQG
ncbi:MAG: GIY-YIG nuclease family protein [bacterium]